MPNTLHLAFTVVNETACILGRQIMSPLWTETICQETRPVQGDDQQKAWDAMYQAFVVAATLAPDAVVFYSDLDVVETLEARRGTEVKPREPYRTSLKTLLLGLEARWPGDHWKAVRIGTEKLAETRELANA